MSLLNTVFCSILLLFLLLSIVYSETCENQTFMETRQENQYANISYRLNIKVDSKYFTQFDILFELCEAQETTTRCTFFWRSSSQKFTSRHWFPGSETLCTVNPPDISSSLLTFEIHISQLVRRSLSHLSLSMTDNNGPYEMLRLQCIDVLYPPEVQNMTVDGHEVSGEEYLIHEGQNVRVSCLFDSGKPPATFRLLDKHGLEVRRAEEKVNFSHSFAVNCSDDWPVIRCESAKSKRNGSLSFLVICPPGFVEERTKVIPLPSLFEKQFRVRSHTTAVEGCFLTPQFLNDASTTRVNCALHGNPPDLFLSLYPGKEISIVEGNWTLVLQNEKGSGAITFTVIKSDCCA